jgi:signal transduction histidine kinase
MDVRIPALPRDPSQGTDARPETGERRLVPVAVPTPSGRRRIERRTSGVLDQVVPLTTALRWGTLALGLLLLTTSRSPGAASIAAGGLLVANTVWRTLRPLRLDPRSRSATLLLVLDVAVVTFAVVLSGRAESPFLLMPIPTLTIAGFGWGNDFGIPASVAVAVSVLAADLVAGASDRILDLGLQAGLAFLASAAIGGLGRRLSIEAAARQQQTLDQMARMSTANDLLLALHRVAQTLPAPLELGEVVASAQQRFRERFDYTSAAVFVKDDASGGWRTELAEGVRLPARLDAQDIPPAAAAVLDGDRAALVQDLFRTGLQGCAPSACSGLYAALRTTRDTVVGLVAIEHTEPDRFSESDADLLAEVAAPLALAIDNALWFGRLRILAADAERARIARDLHDRLAQSLTYVSFELERLAVAHTPAPELESLQEVVRDVVVELRETLHELRAIVTDTVTFADIAREHLARFEPRTGIETTLSVQTSGRRLPVQVEQELWRIAQEALANVERHSGATHVWVAWSTSEKFARLEIRDDGCGFLPWEVSEDRFGIVGMRERADAVGARLTIESGSGDGTRVLVEVEVPT